MRKTLVLVVLVLAVLSGTAGAQEMPLAFCGSLSENDCSILTRSAEAMRGLNAAAFNFQFDFAASNIPDTEVDSISFRMTGDGAYAIQPGALSMMTMSPADMMQNMEDLPKMMEDLLTAIAGDINLVFYLPQNLPTPERLPERVGLSMRLVDGVGYVNLDKLAELDRSGQIPRGWIGIDLVEFFKRAFEAQGDMFNNMPGMDMGMGMNMDMWSAFTNPDFANSFMTVTRGADTTIDGQNAAVFNMVIDLGAMYGSDTFKSAMQAQMDAMMESMGSDEVNMSSEDLGQMMSMFSTLFQGFVINTTQTIGLDDLYVHQTGMTLDWALDLSAMAAAFGETQATRVPPINLNMSFQAGLSQFNNAPAITAPEDAQMVPLNQMFGRGS